MLIRRNIAHLTQVVEVESDGRAVDVVTTVPSHQESTPAVIVYFLVPAELPEIGKRQRRARPSHHHRRVFATIVGWRKVTAERRKVALRARAADAGAAAVTIRGAGGTRS